MQVAVSSAPSTPSNPLPTPSFPSGWVADLARSLGASAGTAREIQDLVTKPLAIVVILAVAWMISWVGTRAIARTLRKVATRAAEVRDAPELANRGETLARSAANLWRAFVWIVALITVLGVLGLDLAPVIASTTVVGAALAFGAQNLVRDYLSGFLLLAENQFAIGDSVDVLDVRGTVESVSLRAIVVRDDGGTRWHIANGEIRKLGNLGRSRAPHGRENDGRHRTDET